MPTLVMDKFLDFLKNKNLIAEEDLKMIISTHLANNEPYEKILEDLHLLNRRQIMEAKAEQFKVEYFDLDSITVEAEIGRLIPESMAKAHKLVCIGKKGNKLIVAMSNPLDIFALDDLKLRTSHEIQPVFSSSDSIFKAWNKVYKELESWQKIVSEVKQKPLDSLKPKEIKLDASAASEEEAPIIRLVDLILNQAVEGKASDIHIETFENSLSVRYRIDGVLHEVMSPPKAIHPPLVSRIKVMSNLDLAEKRLPQDGRMQLAVGKNTIDFRVSCVPALFGEKVVMRILDRTSMLLTLSQLGFSEINLQKFEQGVKQPHGIVLVTGPTGSGKTTTLYAALNTINNKDINIMTIEDPVE
ncbi:MAG: Flp pilus assembly complex ATPase component TadA, partial [Armatimonadetes bacterium]|nr:Flp pilus assembly complex ATPase component TadA [Armatimonadota bacterium]